MNYCYIAFVFLFFSSSFALRSRTTEVVGGMRTPVIIEDPFADSSKLDVVKVLQHNLPDVAKQSAENPSADPEEEAFEDQMKQLDKDLSGPTHSSTSSIAENDNEENTIMDEINVLKDQIKQIKSSTNVLPKLEQKLVDKENEIQFNAEKKKIQNEKEDLKNLKNKEKMIEKKIEGDNEEVQNLQKTKEAIDQKIEKDLSNLKKDQETVQSNPAFIIFRQKLIPRVHHWRPIYPH